MPRSIGKIMMQFLQALAGSPAAPSITGKSVSLFLLTIKNLSVNNSALRYRPKAMDARHGSPPNAVHWARAVTPQTRFGAVTLRAGGGLSAPLCRKPLVVNDTTASLASRAASQIAPGAGLNYLRTSSKLPFNVIGCLYEPESSRPRQAASSKAFQSIPLFQERLSNVQQSQQQ